MSSTEPPTDDLSPPEPEAVYEVEVSISGVGFGPFTLDKLRDRVAEGLLAPEDFARWVNAEEWATVGDFLGEIPDPVPPPPLYIHPPASRIRETRVEETREDEPAPLAECEPLATSISAEPPVPTQASIPGRPLTGPLIRARAGTSTLRGMGGTTGTRPLGGLRSQILARTSQEPLPPIKPMPALRPELAVTTPFRFAPIRPLSPIPPESPEGREETVISVPSPEFAEAPGRPLEAETSWREEAPANAGPLESTPEPALEPIRPPEFNVQPEETEPVEEPLEEPPLPFAVKPTARFDDTISFATPEVELSNTKAKNETAMVRRHALPASKTGSLPVLPVFTITAPAERQVEGELTGGAGENRVPATKIKKPIFILPPRPALARPVADPDSVISVRLPEKRTQVVQGMPEMPPPSPEMREAPAGMGTGVVPGPLSGISHPTSTAPLPAPSRTAQVKRPTSATEVTLASVAAPPPDETKIEQPNLRQGGMSKASALAATTVMPSSAGEPPPENLKPVSSLPARLRTGFGPPERIAPTEGGSGSSTSPPANLAETRRVALKQARLRRRRQGFLFAGVGLVCFLLFGLGIYHYTTSITEPGASPAGQRPAILPAPAAKPSSSTAPAIEKAPTPEPVKAAAPTNPQVIPLINQGQAAQAKGDYDGAIASFDQAVALDPKYPETYSFRAAAKMAKGDIAGAMTDDNQLLTLDPSNAAGFCQRGFVKQAAKDIDGALADYTRAVQLDPRSYVAFYNRGLIQEKAGKADDAIANYNQALILNPKLAGAFYNRGNAKMDKNDLDGAIADYTSALAIDPKIALAFCNRALAEQNQGNLNAAVADYNQGLSIDSKVAMAYYNRGLIEEQRDDLEGCVRDSTTAIELNPDNAQAYYNRGLALQAKGNLEAAAMDLRKFVELAPKNPYADYAHLYLWVITSQQNRKPDANRDLSNVLTSIWNAEPAQLSSKIAAFLLDQISEQDLMGAISTDPKKNPGERCEALYFDGMKQLLNGKKNAATICLNQCLDTGQRDYCEFILAQAQLQAMGP